MHACIRWFGAGSLVVFGLACGSKGSDDGAAGSAAVAGSTSGGETGTSGSVGNPVAGTSAGGTAAGGASSGGTTAVAGTGGTTPVAGSGGTPAGGGSGGGGAAVTKSYSFDTTTEAWKVQYTSSGPVGTTTTMAPLIAVTDPALTVSWLGTDGNPATPPGALQINIPYSSASQYVGVGIALAVKVDLTNKILRANVKVVSGLGDPTDLMTNPGGAKLYAKSGPAYIYAAGAYTNVPPSGATIGTWIPIEFDLSDPSYIAMTEAGTFDASDIREIGIQLDTGGKTTTAMPAVELIDSVTY